MSDDKTMKLTRILLSCMIAALIVPAAYADDNDQQHKFGEKRTDSKAAPNVTVAQATANSQGRFNQPRFNQQQVNGPRPSAAQPNNQFHFTPISTPKPNTPLTSAPAGPQRFQGTNQPSRSDRDAGQKQGLNNQSSHNQGFNNNVRFNNNVNVNNSASFNNNSKMNHRGSDRGGPHFTPGWENHYRMPYRQGNSGGYRVNYAHSWPSNYGWRVHGWREDYRTVDPYWFAVITSMAVAQAWSDAEIAQAINDDNLRQQLIYDADVRQQMIDSGYPAAQVDYPTTSAEGYDSSYSDDQSVPADYAGQDQSNQGQYPNSQEPAAVQSSYYPPPNQPEPSSVNPNSPLYNGGQDATAPSGEQVANVNANKNALFFCTAGNKQEAIQAFSQIQSPDLTIWKTMSSFDRCAAWATP